jgi:phage-related protein
VIWIGDSLKQVKSFPNVVRQDIGVSLFDVQKGSTPDNAKPFKGLGSGVFEIVTRFDKDTYRTVSSMPFRSENESTSSMPFRKNLQKALKQRKRMLI